MFIVIEYNGEYIMGFVLDEDGSIVKFNSLEKASKWCEKNCAFQYKIVEL